MDKYRPNFADDLASIQKDVNTDVGTILKLAKAKPPPTIDTKPAGPVGTAPVLSEPPRRTKKSSPSRRTVEVSESQPLENVTTRLTRETNELLTEVALRRRLKKQSSETRQAVIEAALREYFERHGYAKGDEDDGLDS